MNGKPTAMRRSALFSAATNFSDMLLVVLMVVAARYLGKENFGVLSYAIAISSLYVTLSNFGMSSMAIREVARWPEDIHRYMGSLLVWRMILSIGVYTLLLLSVLFWFDLGRAEAGIVGVVGLAVTLRFFGITGRCFLQALERFDLEMIAAVSEQVILLVVGLALLLMGFGLKALALHLLISRAFGCVIVFVILHRYVGLRFRPDWALTWKLQRQAIPIGVAAFVAMAYLQADTLILKAIASYSDVGLYNAAFKAYFALLAVPSVISTVLMPRLSRSFQQNKAEHNYQLVRGVLVTLALSVPIAIGGILLGPWGVRLVFGPTYDEAHASLQVLMVVIILTYQVWLMRVVLIAVDRQVALMGLSAVGLAVRIGLDIWLVGRLGIVGAAWAVGASELVLLVGGWAHLIRHHFRFAGMTDMTSKVRHALFASSTSPDRLD